MIDSFIKIIFDLFKPSIHNNINKAWKKGSENLHINLFLDKQILLQVLPSRHFIEKGIKFCNKNDMSIIHFFNKNKTNPFNKLEKFETRISEDKFIKFETKKNINFVRNIGNNPKVIENEIFKDIELYGLKEFEKGKIKVEFIDWKERNTKASIQQRI